MTKNMLYKIYLVQNAFKQNILYENYLVHYKNTFKQNMLCENYLVHKFILTKYTL